MLNPDSAQYDANYAARAERSYNHHMAQSRAPSHDLSPHPAPMQAGRALHAFAQDQHTLSIRPDPATSPMGTVYIKHPETGHLYEAENY